MVPNRQLTPTSTPARPSTPARQGGISFTPLALVAALAAVLGALGCEPNRTVIATSKEDARLSGGRDRQGNDLCQRLGWYDDGVCDDFCPRRDPDCDGDGGGSSCGGFTTEPNACAPDEYCHYEPGDFCGAADAPGVCRPRPEACDFIYAPVCGCDGNTYSNECEAHAAGTSVAASGECDEPPPPKQGKSCGGFTAEPNTCGPNEYCHYEPGDFCGAADAPGVCRPRPEDCATLFDPVCGCDGAEYPNECEAARAGTGIANHGPCDQPQGERSCGGFTPTPQTCEPDEFCHYELADICGAADAPGVCRPRPTACDDIYDPVCGCDGKEYANECEANAAGTGISARGGCQ